MNIIIDNSGNGVSAWSTSNGYRRKVEFRLKPPLKERALILMSDHTGDEITRTYA